MYHLTAKDTGSFRTTCVHVSSIADVLKSLESSKIPFFEIGGGQPILDKAGLAAELQRILYPEVPWTVGSWDGMYDLFSMYLSEIKNNYVFLIWHNADQCITNNFNFFLDCMELFNDTGQSLSHGFKGYNNREHPLLLGIVLVGGTSMFPKWVTMENLLAAVALQRAKRGLPMEPGCSDSEIAAIKSKIESSLGITPYDRYLDILRITNGLSENGLEIYAAASQTDKKGVIEENLRLRAESGAFANLLVFASSDTHVYAFDNLADSFIMRSLGGDHKDKSFDFFDEMMICAIKSILIAPD